VLFGVELRDKLGYSLTRFAVYMYNAVEALRIVSRNGGSITRIEPDGTNALHVAMRSSSDVSVLHELYYTFGVTDVNKQDR
jgi:hypothetical protein